MKITKIIFTSLIILIYSYSNSGYSQEYRDPQLIGGQKELDAFICNEIIYPLSAIESKMQGTVSIRLTIDENGDLISQSVIESVSEELDNEALRILDKTKWNPALSMGKPIKSTKKVNIKFNVKKYNKHCKKRGYSIIDYGDKQIDTSNIVYNSKELKMRPMPVFDNKKQNIQSFIAENLKYPDAAYKQNITGIAEVKFIVEPYGRISHVYVDNSLGGGCSQEAIRIAKLMNWQAAEKNGKLVRSWMSLEIKFLLPESGDIDYVPSNSSSAF